MLNTLARPTTRSLAKLSNRTRTCAYRYRWNVTIFFDYIHYTILNTVISIFKTIFSVNYSTAPRAVCTWYNYVINPCIKPLQAGSDCYMSAIHTRQPNTLSIRKRYGTYTYKLSSEMTYGSPKKSYFFISFHLEFQRGGHTLKQT